MQNNQFAHTVWRRYPAALPTLRHMLTVEKATYTEIARALTEASGQHVTKNMVVGMVKRAGLTWLGNPPTPRKAGPVVKRVTMQAGITLPGGYRYDAGRLIMEASS